MVTERLPGFVPWNVGPNSIQSGSDGGRTVAKRMPSGRVGDSILITSAPRVATWCVHAGPAQKAVRSSTVTPASGSVPGGAVSLGAGAAAVTGTTGSASPRTGDADIRNGGRGATNPSG